jgi:hypothetical protein
MSFLDGLLSPALTVGTQAAGTYEQAKAQANDRNTKNFLQSAMLLKGQHDDETNNQLRSAQTAEANARTRMILDPAETWGDYETVMNPQTKQLERIQRSNKGNTKVVGLAPPLPLKLGDPGYLEAEAALAKARADAQAAADNGKTTTTSTTTIKPHVDQKDWMGNPIVETTPRPSLLTVPRIGAAIKPPGQQATNKAAWSAQNPPLPNESREAYKARYAAAAGTP